MNMLPPLHPRQIVGSAMGRPVPIDPSFARWLATMAQTFDRSTAGASSAVPAAVYPAAIPAAVLATYPATPAWPVVAAYADPAATSVPAADYGRPDIGTPFAAYPGDFIIYPEPEYT